MAGNFWCFGCNTTMISKNKPFILIGCSDLNDCSNCDYFCDELCIEKTLLRNIDLSKCNCCEGKVFKEIIDFQK